MPLLERLALMLALNGGESLHRQNWRERPTSPEMTVTAATVGNDEAAVSADTTTQACIARYNKEASSACQDPLAERVSLPPSNDYVETKGERVLAKDRL